MSASRIAGAPELCLDDRTAKWDRRFMRIAMNEISSWSKDPSTKCGALVVVDRNIISTGYNGFPAGVADSVERLSDRAIKNSLIIHAELNALHKATQDVSGGTIYVWPLPPCHQCAGHIISRKISRVVAVIPSEELAQRWGDSNSLAKSLFDEAGVELVLYPEEFLRSA